MSAFVTMALAFVPLSFEEASKDAAGVVIAKYHWRPFWLSYFEVEEVLRGSLDPGATIWTFRQPINGSKRIHGNRYLLLLDANDEPYWSGHSCGTYNLVGLTGDEVEDVSLYDNISPVPIQVTLGDVRLHVATTYRPPQITLLDRLQSGELDLDDVLVMLGNQDDVIRGEAIQALDRLGEDVRPIVSELLQLLRTEPNHNLRYGLVLAVANVKSLEPSVVQSLASVLSDDESAFVRGRAAREFWEMGVNRTVIPDFAIVALVTALQNDPDSEVRSQSAKALASNRRLTQQNRAVLEKCVDDQSPYVSGICEEALRGKYE